MQTIQLVALLFRLLTPTVDQVDLGANVAVIDTTVGTVEVPASELPVGAVEGSKL